MLLNGAQSECSRKKTHAFSASELRNRTVWKIWDLTHDIFLLPGSDNKRTREDNLNKSVKPQYAKMLLLYISWLIRNQNMNMPTESEHAKLSPYRIRTCHHKSLQNPFHYKIIWPKCGS